MMNNLIGVKTDFSIGESLLQAKSLADKAVELGFESVALADTMTISGMVDFSNQMKEKGIKPIIGCTLRIFDDPTYRPPAKKTGEVALPNESFMPRVYIKSEKGFKSLLKLLSVANDEDHYYYTPRASMSELLELEDVIVTTGDMFGLFYHKTRARDYARDLHRRFGEDFLIEVSPINTPLFDTLNKKALQFANEYGVKTIVSYPAFYEDGDKADSLDVYRAITGNGKMSSRSLNIPYVRDFAILETKALLVKALQMSKRIFKDEGEDHSARVKALFANQNYIADNTYYVFEKQAPCLPKMADNEFLTLAQEVQKDRISEALKGLAQIREGVQESYDDVRELLLHFRTRIDSTDLQTAIRSALEKFEGHTGIKTIFEISGNVPDFLPEQVLQIMHIVQESLSNARKHAQASQIKIVLNGADPCVIDIYDNGTGFDVANDAGDDHE